MLAENFQFSYFSITDTFKNLLQFYFFRHGPSEIKFLNFSILNLVEVKVSTWNKWEKIKDFFFS